MQIFQPCNTAGPLPACPENTSTAAQCGRFLAELQLRPIDTYQARAELSIAAPAARVIELREAGHIIYTERVTLVDDNGVQHPRCARYHLLKLADGECPA